MTILAPPPGASPPDPWPASSYAVPLAPPRRSRLLETDVAALATVVSMGIVAIWFRHGGLGALADGWQPMWTSLTELSGLLASGFALAGLVLVARTRAVEARVGLDRAFVWHRIVSETCAVLVGVHVATAVAAWSLDTGLLSALRDLTGREPYMAGATVGALLLGVVTVSSLASVRRRLSYETWYFVHLLGYASLALAYSHEIVVGRDLAGDDVARWFFGLVHVGVLGAVVWARWGRLALATLRPLRVDAVTPVAPATVELRLAGPGLGRVRADAGQFFLLRPLQRGLWWQAHPFSLSGAPDTAGLRFTIKDRGDASRAITALAPGTRVAVEGPYGVCTPDVVADRKVLFVVGGVGVAPVRAMLERLPAGCEPVVVFRARTEAELVHLDDLVRLAHVRGGRVHTLVGPTVSLALTDPFAPEVLRGVVPDLADRVAVLCGPERLLHAARAGLLAAGVRSDDIHFERPWW